MFLEKKIKGDVIMQKSGSGRRIGAFFLDSLIFTFGSSIILSIFEDPTYTQQLLEIERRNKI